MKFPFDRQILLMSMLAGMMVLLFVYLVQVDREIANYQLYKSKIRGMLLLDKSFDNFLQRKIEAINYETINGKMDRFEKILDYFDARPLAKEYGPNLPRSFEAIKRAYQNKREAIEHFKTYNAEAINSVHYLFDLRQTIANHTSLPEGTQILLDKILFKLMQMIVGVAPNEKELLRELSHVKTMTVTLDDRLLEYFYRHSLTLMEAVQHLEAASRQGISIPLSRKILTAERVLDIDYRHKFSLEKEIAVIFFVIAFMLIALIAWLNHQSKLTSKRLQAFMYAVENSDNTIVMTDTQRRIVYVNEVFEQKSGYTKEEALGQNPRILKSGKQSDAFYEQMNRTLEAGKKWEGVFINKRKDGTLFYEKASIVPVYIDGKLTNYLAIKLDITDYVEQEKRLKLSAAVFENTHEAIFVTDSQYRIVSVNPAFTKLTGYREEQIVGQTPQFLESQQHDDSFYHQMWQTIRHTRSWQGKIYIRIRSNQTVPTWMAVTALFDDKGEILNYIGMLTDLREIMQSQEKADYLAYHDNLTGLPNRAYFEDHLHHAIEVANRKKSPLAVLFIDLDRFKVINDTLGHDIGDRLLKTIGARLRSTLRQSDIVARIGGDEFIAVMETVDTAEDTAHVCEKILQVVAEPIEIDNHTLHITASIGVALFPDNGTTITDLIKNADNAMYLAKSVGKNNFQFFVPELSRQMHRRLEIEQGMTDALTNEEFWLAYQPQYDIENGRLYGAEALIRWQSATLGFVPPDEFIPIAEENGKINEIGLFVFEEACRTLVQMDRLGLHLPKLSINVSSKQFGDKNLPERFAGIAQEHGIETTRLTIEMTERYIMDTASYDAKILDRFKSLGFGLSIDDFGTGYSSMSYLKKLPVDTIKIDRSFIMDIPEDNSDKEITKAIIALAKSLNYEIVAEGIENEAQERFLLEHGCRLGQGYLFSRPLERQAFFEFVEDRQRNSS